MAWNSPRVCLKRPGLHKVLILARRLSMGSVPLWGRPHYYARPRGLGVKAVSLHGGRWRDCRCVVGPRSRSLPLFSPELFDKGGLTGLP